MAERAITTARDAQREPSDLDAERALLGAILLGEQWGESVLPLVAGIVRREDFYHPAHAVIFDCITTIAARSSAQKTSPEKIDAITIAAELRTRDRLNAVGGVQYVGDLTDHATGPSSAEQHARIVADCAHRRRVVAAAREAIERAQRGGQTWAGDVSAAVGAALAARPADRVVSLASVAGSVADRVVDRRGKVGARGVSLLLRSVQRLVPSGGLPGQFIVIAALPGCGKSTLMFQVALVESRAEREGVPCRALYFSKEMDTADLAERALCAEALISGTRAATGALEEDEARALYAAVAQLERTRLSIDDRAGLTLEEVRARCLREKADAERAAEQLTLVCIDYLQLMAKPRADTEALAIEKLTGGLKNLARELGVTIIAASQLNRKSEETRRRPQLSDLRGSGGIGQDADKVLFIHAELDADGKPKPEVEIIVAKQRYGGGTGIARALFVRELTVFRDVESDVADEGSVE